MAYTDTYFIGSTQVVVPTGITATPVVFGNYVNGGFFKIQSGAGTLSIVQASGVSYTLGYPIGAAEVVSFSGPSRFFLVASGATMVVACATSFSQGVSAAP